MVVTNTVLGSVALILTISIGFSVSLRCYQCVDSGTEDTDCQNATLLLNSTNVHYKEGDLEGDAWKRNKYFKDCDNENITMCMIEIFTSQTGIKSYHRDCTDGQTFSFKTDKFLRLTNLLPNNETTCTFDSELSGQHICLQLCVGNMCNGPKLTDSQKETPKCRNETDVFGDVTEVCGASSLTHFLTFTSVNFMYPGLLGFSALVYFLCLTSLL